MAKKKNHILIRIAINMVSLAITAYILQGINVYEAVWAQFLI